MIGDEPGNTNKDPDASEKAVPKSEGRAELPFLSALRQDVPGRYSGPCLALAKSNQGAPGVDGQTFWGIETLGLEEPSAYMLGSAAMRRQKAAASKSKGVLQSKLDLPHGHL